MVIATLECRAGSPARSKAADRKSERKCLNSFVKCPKVVSKTPGDCPFLQLYDKYVNKCNTSQDHRTILVQSNASAMLRLFVCSYLPTPLPVVVSHLLGTSGGLPYFVCHAFLDQWDKPKSYSPPFSSCAQTSESNVESPTLKYSPS